MSYTQIYAVCPSTFSETATGAAPCKINPRELAANVQFVQTSKSSTAWSFCSSMSTCAAVPIIHLFLSDVALGCDHRFIKPVLRTQSVCQCDGGQYIWGHSEQ